VFVECQSLIENNAERLQRCSDWQHHTSHFDGVDRGRGMQLVGVQQQVVRHTSHVHAPRSSMTSARRVLVLSRWLGWTGTVECHLHTVDV